MSAAFVDVGLARIRVRATGEVGAPGVLLLHGGRFSSADWEALGTLDELARAGYRAVAVDLPGFGESPALEGGEPGAFLGALIEALELGRPVLVSPSMSGRFSLPLVASHPERLAGFVPVGVAGSASFRGALAGVELPTLVVWGGADDTLAEGRALAAALVGAELEVLEGATHACYLDQPDAFHRLLIEFCAQSSMK